MQLGMGSALETLCGQAFGAGQVAMLGVYLQRSWIVLIAASLLMVPFYALAEPLLLAIGQDAESARGLAFTLDQLQALELSPPELLSWLQAQAPEAPRWVLRLLLGASGR